MARTKRSVATKRKAGKDSSPPAKKSKAIPIDSEALDAFKNVGLYDDSDLQEESKSKPKPKPSKKVPKKKKVAKSVHSDAQKYAALYRDVDRFMEKEVADYRRLKQFHPVVKIVEAGGKKKKTTSEESVFTLLVKEHKCPFNMFVKMIQRGSIWIPDIVPDHDLRNIAHAGEELGWINLLKDERLVVQKSDEDKDFLFVTLQGSNAKFDSWQFNPVPTKFSSEKGLLILMRIFAICYSNFWAKVQARKSIDAISSEVLGRMTGHAPSLFDEIGKATVVLAGVDLKKLKSLYGVHITGAMNKAKQRKLKNAVLTYFVDNFDTLKKSKIVQDFTLIFPKVFQNILKQSLT